MTKRLKLTTMFLLGFLALGVVMSGNSLIITNALAAIW
jgi:hypothetical protein